MHHGRKKESRRGWDRKKPPWIFKYKSSEADCFGTAHMRIISVLQHLSKYVKIPESVVGVLVDNGEVRELFVQKLPCCWFGVWSTVLWADVSMVFLIIWDLCYVHKNVVIVLSHPYNQLLNTGHLSGVGAPFSDLSVTCTETLWFHINSLHSSWWLPYGDQTTMFVATAPETPFETLSQAVHTDNETENWCW